MRFFRLRPMALFGLAFFLCSVSATYLDRLRMIAGAAAAAIVCLAALAVFAVRRTDDARRRQGRAALISLLLAPVLALSLSAWRSWRDETVVPEEDEVSAVCVVRSRCDASTGTAQYLLAVRSVDGERASFKASVLLRDRSYIPGDVLEITGSFIATGSSYPEGERRLRALGAAAECDPTSVLLVGEDHSPASFLGRLREKIGARIAGDMGENAPIVTALVTGDRSGVDPSLRLAFSELGISHVLAVSGLHMSIIAGFVALSFRPFGRRRYFAIIAAVLFYAAISGFAMSAVRSAVMLVICSIAGIIGRRTDSVSVVALAVALIVVASPGAAWDTGFLLSALSVFALAASPVRRLSEREDLSLPRRLGRAVLASVSATVTVSIVTLPVTAREFGAISLAAPVANLIFIPLVTLVLYAAPVYLAATFVPYLGGAIGSALDLYLSLVCRLARWMSGLGTLVSLDVPAMGVLSVVLCVSFIALLVAKKRKLPAIVAAATVCAMVLSGALFELGRANEVTVKASACDAGDVIAVTDGASLYIVDCARGNAAFRRRVSEVRRELSAVRIEKYVFTHVHKDSAVYLSKLLSSASVGVVVLPTPRDGTERDVCMRMAEIALAAGAEVELAGGAVALGNAALDMQIVCDLPSSVEPLIALTVRAGERSVCYVGAGFFGAPAESRAAVDLSGADALIAGTHGGRSDGDVAGGFGAIALAEGEDFSVTWEK